MVQLPPPTNPTPLKPTPAVIDATIPLSDDDSSEVLLTVDDNANADSGAFAAWLKGLVFPESGTAQVGRHASLGKDGDKDNGDDSANGDVVIVAKEMQTTAIEDSLIPWQQQRQAQSQSVEFRQDTSAACTTMCKFFPAPNPFNYIGDDKASMFANLGVDPAKAKRQNSDRQPHRITGSTNAADVINRQLQQLSISEQDQVFQDIHGTGRIAEETDSFMIAKLDDLDLGLSLIPSKPAYDEAQIQSPGFPSDMRLRKQFLRADHYNPQRAANRLVRWFDIKKELFGASSLGRHLTIDDLCPDALQALRCGHIQILPARDNAGRAVMSKINMHKILHLPAKALLQMMFYIIMRIAEDEDTQKSGIVLIYEARGWRMDLSANEREFLWKASLMTLTLPIKIQCVHFVSDRDWAVQRFANLLQLGLTRSVRFRFRAHFGTHCECKYALMGYGIPISSLPLQDDGKTLDTQHHNLWLDRQFQIEAAYANSPTPIAPSPARPSKPSGIAVPKDEQCTKNDDDGKPAKDPSDGSTHSSPTGLGGMPQTVDLPGRYDVLLGRGRPFQEHPGNRHLRDLIAECLDHYNAARKSDKTAIAEQIANSIHEKGGKFLKKDPDGPWVQVSFMETREKIAHAFRKKRELDKAKLKQSDAAASAGTGKKRKASTRSTSKAKK